MAEYTPFDPADPADAVADLFRRQVAEIALEVGNMPIYQQLGPRRQVESIMGGVLVGLIGVLFAHVTPEGRKPIMRAIKEYLPQARANAEGMIGDSSYVGQEKP